MKKLLAFVVALLVLVGCSSAPKHKMPTSMDQHGTPSYLDERDKGLFYALIVNESSHMVVVEILDYETGETVWTSKTLLTEKESLKRNPQQSFKGRPETMDGVDHVCHIYLYEGTYIMRISKWCEHTGKWKSKDIKFIIAKECTDINTPCFDVNDRSNQGPPELVIGDEPHVDECCSDS